MGMVVPDDTHASLTRGPDVVEQGLRIDFEMVRRIGSGIGALNDAADMAVAVSDQQPAAFQRIRLQRRRADRIRVFLPQNDPRAHG